MKFGMVVPKMYFPNSIWLKVFGLQSTGFCLMQRASIGRRESMRFSSKARHLVAIRASENFRGCLPQYPPKNLGQILAALAISGIFERFSPGQSGSEVGGPGGLFIYMGPPTSEPLWPGENLSKMPEFARAARIWPKFFGGY